MSEVTIREYLEQRLDYERSLVEQRFALIDQARQLQAAEYERRLVVLNHAHEQAVAESARVVPRELFEQFLKEYGAFKLDTRESLTAIASRSAVWTAAIGLGFLILNVALMWHR
jgi:hypothetical protein